MFEIRLNGQLFTLWESANLQRSIDMNSGIFQFSSTTNAPADYPVKAGDKVQIVIDGITKLTGYVDGLVSSGSKQAGQIVRVTGRDNTADLIDSSMPDAVKSINTPISLKSLCEKVIAALGIEMKVIDRVGDLTEFGTDVTIDADSGKKCMTFLTDFARKKQVYLVSDGEGNLVIYRPDGSKSATTITQKKDGSFNNVKEYSYAVDDSGRFNKYVVRSQDNFGASDFADYAGEGVSRTGTVTDSQIRSTRYLEIQAEESMKDSEINERANEEANIRRARGFQYDPTVVGTSQSNGVLWDFGILVPVMDEITGVNGTYLIRSVNYSVDLNDGTATKLSITRPEGYNVRGALTKQDIRIAPTDNRCQLSTPSAKLEFVRKEGGFGN